jgi:hypothetical protein
MSLNTFDEFENLFPMIQQVEEVIISTTDGKSEPTGAIRTDISIELYDPNWREWMPVWTGQARTGKYSFKGFSQQFAPMDISGLRIVSTPWRSPTFTGWQDTVFTFRR